VTVTIEKGYRSLPRYELVPPKHFLAHTFAFCYDYKARFFTLLSRKSLSLLTMVQRGKTRITMRMKLSLDQLHGEASFVSFAELHESRTVMISPRLPQTRTHTHITILHITSLALIVLFFLLSSAAAAVRGKKVSRRLDDDLGGKPYVNEVRCICM
jgi:hypothetical protein